MKMTDSVVRNFLYGGHINDDKFRMPDSSLFIGTGFEIGGTYEDWGFGVFKYSNNKMNLIASGRTIEEAITKAQKLFICDHEWGDNGWCNKCKGHKTFLS